MQYCRNSMHLIPSTIKSNIENDSVYIVFFSLSVDTRYCKFESIKITVFFLKKEIFITQDKFPAILASQRSFRYDFQVKHFPSQCVELIDLVQSGVVCKCRARDSQFCQWLSIIADVYVLCSDDFAANFKLQIKTAVWLVNVENNGDSTDFPMKCFQSI